APVWVCGCVGVWVTACCLLPTADCRLPTADCRLLAADRADAHSAAVLTKVRVDLVGPVLEGRDEGRGGDLAQAADGSVGHRGRQLVEEREIGVAAFAPAPALQHRDELFGSDPAR